MAQEGMARFPQRLRVVGLALLWLSLQAHSAKFHKLYLDSTVLALCPPQRVYLPDTYLRLPKAYCGLQCSKDDCTVFVYSNQECLLFRVFLSPGYTVEETRPGALEAYRPLADHELRPDVGLFATVIADSNKYSWPTFQDQLTRGVMCRRVLPHCPCTAAPAEPVTIDLDTPHHITRIVAVTSDPHEDVSQEFSIFVGNERDIDLGEMFWAGELTPHTNAFNIKIGVEGQFITFYKSDNLLCLCLVQVFD